jgi:glycosyltransferase involved in cell wall biosynthesis
VKVEKNYKRVAILTTTFPRYIKDKTPAFIFELSKEIKKKEFNVLIIAPHDKGIKKKEFMDRIEVVRFSYFYPTKFQKLCYEGGIMRNIRKSFLAKIQVPFFLLSFFYFSYKFIKKRKIKIINSHWILPSGLIGGILRKILKIKHISTAHAIDVYTIEKIPFGKTLTKFIYENSDYMICVNEDLKKRILKLLNMEESSKIFIKPMGTNIKFIDKKINNKKEFNVLFIGRFVEKKGLEYLIKAISEVKKEYSEIKLLVAGAGPLEEKIKNMVKELNLEDTVKFLGWVEREKIQEVFELSDVLVVPSIVTEEGDTEGMPTVILEAMAAGVPVIATCVGGISYFVKNYENGILIEEKNPLQIKEKILELYKNKELREKIIKSAKEFAQDFTFDKIAEFYISLFVKSFSKKL